MITFPFATQSQVHLKKWSTLEIGGTAKWFLEVHDTATLQKAIQFCHSEKIPYYIIGKGSNILFDDRGFDGLVIANKIHSLEELAPGRFKAGAGYSFSLLGTKTATKGFAGIEFAAGIPASVGGAIFMNAGTGPDETEKHLLEVEWISPTGEYHRFSRSELHFGYRESSFQKWGGAITSATFQLKEDPLARERQKAQIEYRTRTQPYGERSAGCVFRNPSCGSAGSIIDRLNLKGFNIGGCEVSTLHANFLINKHEGTSSDFLKLISAVQEKVKTETGVELTPEIRIVPFG